MEAYFSTTNLRPSSSNDAAPWLREPGLLP